jgi:hypothetical protein
LLSKFREQVSEDTLDLGRRAQSRQIFVEEDADHWWKRFDSVHCPTANDQALSGRRHAACHCHP